MEIFKKKYGASYLCIFLNILGFEPSIFIEYFPIFILFFKMKLKT
jgi:hypothetical protein